MNSKCDKCDNDADWFSDSDPNYCVEHFPYTNEEYEYYLKRQAAEPYEEF